MLGKASLIVLALAASALALPSAAPLAVGVCNSFQNPHAYVIGPTAHNAEDGGDAPAEGVAVGQAVFVDTCTTGDGDPDLGIGGGFFPSGDCSGNGHHFPSTVTVTNAVPADVYFVVAGNDVGTGSCVSDGIISPDADPGDWFEICENTCTLPGHFGPVDAVDNCPPPPDNNHYLYGGDGAPGGAPGGALNGPSSDCPGTIDEVAGADGGFFVFVDPGIVAEFDEGAVDASAPTMGFIFTG